MTAGRSHCIRPISHARSCPQTIAVTTIGNLIGGSLLVGVIYWFVYLRRRS